MFYYLTYHEILLLIAIILATSVTILSISLRKKNNAQKIIIETLTEDLTHAQHELERFEGIEKKFNDFKKDLDQAAITTKLQKSRLDFNQPTPKNNPPERYSYIKTLTQKGFSCEEIASVLSISKDEAEQLITLSELNKKVS